MIRNGRQVPGAGVLADDQRAFRCAENQIEPQESDLSRIPLTLASTAESIAASGFAVHPCAARGKEPRLRGWPERATSDVGQISAWWNEWPDANIGVATGRNHGLWVLDIDSDDGEKWLTALEDANGKLADTFSVRTANGRHLYFQYPRDTECAIRNSNDKRRFPADVRGDGGYVIAPPSIHPTGAEYAVLTDCPLSPAPQWLLSIVATGSRRSGDRKTKSANARMQRSQLSPKIEQRVLTYLDNCPPAVSGDSGHNTAYSIVCTVVLGFELSFDDAVRLLQTWNDRCDPPWSDDELKHKVQDALDAAPPPGKKRGWLLRTSPTAKKYNVESGRLCRVVTTESGDQYFSPLADFAAWIVKEVTIDDGVERTKLLEVAGELPNGEKLDNVLVHASEFESFGWVPTQWGVRAKIHPGRGVKDELRYAIQCLSADAAQETRYGHFGWRTINGQMYYLHAGGAIGASGAMTDVCVEAPDKLKNFCLPAPPDVDACRRAVQSVLALYELSRHEITLPIIGAVFRAVIGDADFSLFIEGQHGTFKTALAALAQSFFGLQLHAANLPASWRSTANATEYVAFVAKDTLIVVDDFCPRGDSREVQRYHRSADELLRGAANHQGRQRLKPDGTLRPHRAPRCLFLATGETLPDGQSLRGRLVVVPLQAGDIDKGKLTECQKCASMGLYADAMAGLIRWLAPQILNFKEQWKDWVAEKRHEISSSIHVSARAPSNVAECLFGFMLFANYAQEVGAISPAERESLFMSANQAVDSLLTVQNAHQHDADPIDRFLQLVRSGLASGKLRLKSREPTRIEPFGATMASEMIGYRSSEQIWLLPAVAFGAAQSLASKQGEPLSFGQSTLGRRLGDAGFLIAVGENGRPDPKRKVPDGTRHRVWILSPATLGYEPEPDENDSTRK